ncbi:insulin-like 3 (Leydig cell) [Cololabis saira]|uniref:insulin-like 3 (Leydig cell) n=1 Tax=Cololabis saira TaxID=129043 RepID=UPI002AD54D2E|nr:insulin-like 3 (Leydig cell) [Cololabis saira]
MKTTKCLLSLMVVLGAVGCAAKEQDRIKMCGRELIRLAVSYCGNSRLRRSIPDAELVQNHYTTRWGQDVYPEEHQASATAPVPSQPDGRKDVFSSAPHLYPMSFRIRRAPGKISDICCEKGCSLKELIQFC